jgi:alkaline phosphatase
MYKHRSVVSLILAFILLAVAGCGVTPKNVVLFIGDGMGPEQVKAAGIYANGAEGTLVFETFAYQTEATTYSASSEITDSAASATAMATGRKVNNGVVSLAIPGDGAALTTMLEYFQEAGKSCGLVTTTNITHATPACFGAHRKSRYDDAADIAADYLNLTRPQLLFGGGWDEAGPKVAADAGYLVVRNREELFAIDTENSGRVSGQFGEGHLPHEIDGLGDLPHLGQMTAVALTILDNDPDGFFLMVEGGAIDHAGHDNNLEDNILETVEFSRSVKAALEWAKGRGDTLIVVTADHETGGLKVFTNNGKGELPDVSWSTGKHTAADVPVYATGPGAQSFAERIDNTDIFYKIMEVSGISHLGGKYLGHKLPQGAGR